MSKACPDCRFGPPVVVPCDRHRDMAAAGDDYVRAITTDGHEMCRTAYQRDLQGLRDDVDDLRSCQAVAEAKEAMYVGWLREHHPDCPLLAENIVLHCDCCPRRLITEREIETGRCWACCRDEAPHTASTSSVGGDRVTNNQEAE